MRIAKRPSAAHETLETRRCLSAFGFAQHDFDKPDPSGSTSMILADLDGDQDLDLLSENIWRPNDGTSTFGKARLMFTDHEVDQLFAGDLDQDGDLDVVASGRSRSEGVRTVSWFENLNGRGYLGPAQLVAQIDERFPSTVLIGGDIDGDGDIDLIEGSRSTRLFENTDGRGTFAVSESWDEPGLVHVVLYDVDDDGDLDIVGSQPFTALVLLENQGGDFSNRKLLDGYGPLFIDDVNKDRTLDFIVGENEGVRWYEFDAESMELALRETIRSIEFEVFSVVKRITAGDIDADGDLDLAAVITIDSPSTGHMIEAFQLDDVGYQDADVLYNESRVNGGDSGLWLCDLDGNGTSEILYNSATREFDVATRQFSEPVHFADPYADERRPQGHQLADIDGDGDLDAVESDWIGGCEMGYSVPCRASIFWYENVDGKGAFAPRGELWQGHPDIVYGIRALATADIDGDGDLDIVWDAPGAGDAAIQWMENTDGLATFGPALPISDSRLLSITDLDGDGRLDLVTDEGREVVAYFDILDAANGDQVTFSSGGPRHPLLDWDQDGDLDVVGGINRNVVWYENQGSRSFAARQKILPFDDFTRGYDFADLDADGDLDVLWTTYFDVNLVWRENLGSDGWGPIQVIAERAGLLRTMDMDRDGDPDIRANLLDDQRSGTVLFFNNGQGQFTLRSPAVPPFVAAWGDIDGDDDLDVLAINGTWYERRVLGDSNGDGVFDSADLVVVLQAGEYEDWLSDNSTFQTGDWNGDGDFDSSDLVWAYQAGHYETARALPKGQIAAAVDLSFAADDADAKKPRAFVA